VKCPICSFENPDGARFCQNCGLQFPGQPPKKPNPFVCLLKALCYYLLFFGMQSLVLVVYIFSLVFGETMGLVMNPGASYEDFYSEDIMNGLMESTMERLAENMHLLLILSGALTLLFLFLFFQLRRRNPLQEISLRPAPVSKLLLALVLGAALNFFVSITMSLLPIPEILIETFEENSALLYGSSPLMLELFSIAVLTPILEEVIFRGLIFTRLRRGMHTVIAMIIGALIFGSAHGHIISLIYAGALGVLLTVLMIKCGDSILVPIFCHAGFNGGSYLLTAILGDTESLPLILGFYMVSLALTVLSAYLLLRPAQQPEEG